MSSYGLEYGRPMSEGDHSAAALRRAPRGETGAWRAPASREDVVREVEALAADWQDGDPSDPEQRQSAHLRLAALRGVFRELPSLFDPGMVEDLKVIAASLRGTTPVVPMTGSGPSPGAARSSS